MPESEATGKRVLLVEDDTVAQRIVAHVLALPRGTIREGTLTVSSSGAAGVGAFQTSVAVPPPIQLLSNFPPNALLDTSKPLEVRWTGGRAGDMVRLRLTELGVPDWPHSFCECSFPAMAGAAVIPLAYWGRQFPPTLPFSSLSDKEITVTQESAAEGVARFSATGLSAGGQHRWVYQWRFGGLPGATSICETNPATPGCPAK